MDSSAWSPASTMYFGTTGKSPLSVRALGNKSQRWTLTILKKRGIKCNNWQGFKRAQAQERNRKKASPQAPEQQEAQNHPLAGKHFIRTLMPEQRDIAANEVPALQHPGVQGPRLRQELPSGWTLVMYPHLLLGTWRGSICPQASVVRGGVLPSSKPTPKSKSCTLAKGALDSEQPKTPSRTCPNVSEPL